MKQMGRWTVVAVAGAIFVMICILMISLSTFAYGAMVANGTLTPTVWVYLPYINREEISTPAPAPIPTETPTPTSTPMATETPTLPPPSFDGCQEDPDPASAPNFPVRIVTVDKDANPEVVWLQNVSTQVIDLTDWHVCSINGNQEHTGISGTLAPDETKDFPYTGSRFIWNNRERDDGALYNANGQLASYWVDQ